MMCISPTSLSHDAPRSQGRLFYLRPSLRSSGCRHPSGSCNNPQMSDKTRKNGGGGRPSTYSCFKPSIFSFNLALRASTSRRKAADCARIAAVSARVRVVISARISDSAARKRYACCSSPKQKNKNSQKMCTGWGSCDAGSTLRCRDPCT
jgi:hypothetical protein